MATIAEPEARRIADLYRRVASRLRRADPIERMALIHLTACQEAPDLERLEPPVAPAWRCRWAAWQSTAPHLAMTGHEGWVMAVAFGAVDGAPVIVSGGYDGTVRLWDARSGEALGAPLTGHGRPVNAVAGLVHGGDAGQSQFLGQALLQGGEHALASPPGLGRQSQAPRIPTSAGIPQMAPPNRRQW